jgi:hypothetical protein
MNRILWTNTDNQPEFAPSTRIVERHVSLEKSGDELVVSRGTIVVETRHQDAMGNEKWEEMTWEHPATERAIRRFIRELTKNRDGEVFAHKLNEKPSTSKPVRHD